jgi:hypothetical protein
LIVTGLQQLCNRVGDRHQQILGRFDTLVRNAPRLRAGFPGELLIRASAREKPVERGGIAAFSHFASFEQPPASFAQSVNPAADDRLDRGLALLHAAAVKGRVNVCPRGAALFVIEVPDANVSRSRSYRGTLKVEGHVDGLRWHNLAFSVHGAPVPNPGGSDDLNSGKRFFSGKVDARIFLKLLPHFIDRSICVFELHEFVDPLGIPGKGSTYEMSSFEFVRKPDTGLFAE